MAETTTAITGNATPWSDTYYGASGVATGVSNIASSILNYKAAEVGTARSVRAAKKQRDRQIREMTEAFIQQEAAEKVSLWESGLEYRGTAEAIEESNIKTRETQLEETRQYYADMISDLKRAERSAKRGSLFSGIGTALGMVGGAVLAPFTGGTSLMMGAAIGGSLGGAAGSLAGSVTQQEKDDG